MIFALGTTVCFGAYILGGRVYRFGQLFVLVVALVVGVLIAWFMFSAATTELQTLIEHYAFMSAQQETRLREWTSKFLSTYRALALEGS